jgi:class 3 adenylate cyclase/tetratricopeptide (TPR) repeat protein
VTACPRCGHPNETDARFCSNCGLALAPATVEGEQRKTVTIMFCDVAGSTALGERTDPESLRRVLARYFDEIRSIVERHGGRVEKFIGDAVMAVFGLPAVHEDDALRAARAAIEIRRRLAELATDVQRERGVTIEWRTGINTGEVVAGDTGAGPTLITGDPVNVAARLEQAARPGEVLIGAATLEMLGDLAETEPVEPIRAKGKSEPVAAHRLLDVAGVGERARRLDGPMVGRQRHRRLLEAAYEQAVSERVCHLFTVLGAAGVGKSRLVREFLGGIGDETLVLRGRCLSYGEGITYWPIAEVVREAAGMAEGDDDATVRAKIGALIASSHDRAQAVRLLGDLIGRLEGGASRDETFWAVRTMLESLAGRRPVTLVLDDLHWAEPTLLDLIEHLADWTADAPVLLVCMGRRELLEARPGWSGGKQHATTVTLEPLNVDQSRELVSNLLGRVELGGGLTERIAAAAEGNPLFVEEMVGMLIDRGHLEQRNGACVAVGDLAEVAVPPTIQALLAARLDGLPADERMVLERAAIEGQIFHQSAVAELAPEALKGRVADELRALTRKELVRPERREPDDLGDDEAFRFRHLLIRDAAYGALPKQTRADLHARFARWLERTRADRLGEYEEILGYHYEQAHRYRAELGPLDEEGLEFGRRAGHHLRTAAERAIDRGDVDAARSLLASALALAGDDPAARAALQAELGLALLMSGELRQADEVLAEASALASAAGDEPAQAYAEVIRLSNAGSFATMTVAQIISRAEELLAILDRHGHERGIRRATLELARSHFFAGHARRAVDILEQGLARTTEAGYTPVFAWIPQSMLHGPTPVDEAMRRMSQLLATKPSRAAEADVLCALGPLHALIGDFDQARRLTERAVAIREELHQVVTADAERGNFLAPVEALAGNLERAQQLLVDSYEALTEAGERGYASTIAGQLADLYVETGRIDDADHYAQLARELASADDVDAQTRSLCVQARVMTARGQTQAALAAAAAAVAMIERTDYLELKGKAYLDLAEVRLAAGDRAGATTALETAAANFEAKGATFLVARARGRLAELAAADSAAI